MRALIISHAAIRSSNRRIYRALAVRGWDVTLLIPDTWKSGLGALRAEPEPPSSHLRVEVRRRRGMSLSNVYWLEGFAQFVRELQPEAMYVDEDPAGLVAAQAARSARAEHAGLVVLAIQNLFKRYPPPFGLLQRYVLAAANTAVATSEQAAEVLRRRGYRGPMRMMPFSTDLEQASETERAAAKTEYGLESPLVGYAGRLVPEKGIDVFLRALALVPRARAAIVGDGPERAALEQLAAELNVADRVRFMGVQTPTDTIRILSCFDVLALPSRTRRNWAEQFGRILIEAMACGVPVVASDSGAIGEVVSDAGILVPEGDPEALASALERALDPQTNRDLQGRGLARVAQHYRGEVEVRALEESLAAAHDAYPQAGHAQVASG